MLYFVQQSKVENLARLYEIDDHPERRAWLDKLLTFMEDRGTPIAQCPTISKNPLDLYRLYLYTKDRGGFLEVIIIGFPNSPQKILCRYRCCMLGN